MRQAFLPYAKTGFESSAQKKKKIQQVTAATCGL